MFFGFTIKNVAVARLFSGQLNVSIINKTNGVYFHQFCRTSINELRSTATVNIMILTYITLMQVWKYVDKQAILLSACCVEFLDT